MADDSSRASPLPAPFEPARESDADLLACMSLAREEPAAARAAWEEFYRRHAGYLHAVCLRAYGPLLGGEAGAADLAAETLLRAYEHADTFNDGGLREPERLRRRTRAWLGRIAQRLMQSQLRGRARMPERFLDQELWQRVAGPERPAATDGGRTARVRQALLALSEREQLTLRVTLQWQDPEQANQRLPGDVVKDLARALRTTPENLRQIRRRALRKVAAMLRATENEARP